MSLSKENKEWLDDKELTLTDRYDASVHNLVPSKDVKAKLLELEAEIAKRDERIADLDAAVSVVASLTEQSSGVTGVHLNGDVASWHELLESVEFEDWMSPLSKALTHKEQDHE